jgi:predicted HicB family RNase H-like nuclease
MKYKGYIGRVSYDHEAKILHGDVIGIKDVITFEGTNVEEIEQAFRDSVDVYLDLCEKRGEKPEKTFTGNLRVRIAPNLHAQLAQEASLSGLSLNSLIAEKLKN